MNYQILKNGSFPLAKVGCSRLGRYNHYFMLGTIVQPIDFNGVAFLCRYVSNGLPDREQWVHKDDLLKIKRHELSK